MANYLLLSFLLVLAPAAAQTHDTNRITINARGQALAQDAPAPAPHQAYAQLVNGSTPTGWMEIGTPPKWLLVIFDTGSNKLVAKTWDTVRAELASVDQGIKGMVMPSAKMYNHNTSSTYVRKFMINPHTNQSVPAQNEIAYGSGVAITDEGNDTIKIGSFLLNNFSLSEITQDSLALMHTSKGISGILGLQHMKNKSFGSSLFSKMRDDNLITAFGYCRGTNDNGTFLWGDTSTEGDKLDVLGQMHWAVSLGNVAMNGNGTAHTARKIHNAHHIVGGTHHSHTSNTLAGDGDGDGDSFIAKNRRKRATQPAASDDASSDSSDDKEAAAPEDGSTEKEADETSEEDDEANSTLPHPCHDGKCIAILDTGSNIIAGPTAVMKALSDKANVASDCSNFDSLPEITFDFGGKAVTVSPKGYVMKVPMPKWASMGGGGASGDGDGDGSGSSLDEQGATAGSGWPEVFEHMAKIRGIDLRTALRNMKFENSTVASQPQFLCMPALVPLDKTTTFGPLYIVGTPLLETHYARWSFPANAASPEIHIKKLADADVCKTAHVGAAAHPSLEANGPASASLMRTEQRQTSEHHSGTVRSEGPTIRNIEDISYPHWAKDLDDI